MDACDSFKGWNGQSEPTVRHQKGKPVPKIADIVGKVRFLWLTKFVLTSLPLQFMENENLEFGTIPDSLPMHRCNPI